MDKTLVDIKSGRDYSNLFPGCIDNTPDYISGSDDLVFSNMILPSSLDDGIAIPSTSEHIVGVAVSDVTIQGQYRHEGGAWQKATIRKGMFGLGEACYNAIDWQWRSDQDEAQLDFLVAHFSSARMNKIALEVFGIDDASIEMPHQIGNEDPVIFHLMVALRDEILRNGELCALYHQSFMQMISVHLLSRHCVITRKPVKVKGGLDSDRLKRVTDYIEAHFNQTISLDGLAEQCHLSTYHFMRLFKQATGLSPRQYIVSRRVHYARKLLDKSNLTVDQISAAVGYSSPYHFSRIFKRHTGYSPGKYRDAVIN